MAMESPGKDGTEGDASAKPPLTGQKQRRGRCIQDQQRRGRGLRSL